MKTVSRRRFLHLAASAAALPGTARLALAQSYPTRPVRLISSFAAGGPNDLLARLIGQWLSERLGQPFIIDNRPGAGGTIGTEVAAKAPPDGYTLLLVAPANVVNVTLYDKLSFNFMRDIAPVGGLTRVPNVMEVNPAFPARTVAEFIAYAKANPGTINMASGGNGSAAHVCGELFKIMTGIEMVHVAYRGLGPALTDLLAGQVQVIFDSVPNSIGHIRAGRLRALGTTTATRLEALPDIPTVGETVAGYEASALAGLGAPRNTPAEIVATINRELNAGLADPKMRARLADLGGTPIPGSPGDYGTLLAAEIEKWGNVIRSANIRLE
ncbi:MAG TPA: tripartite tricarboxylate transporter substrate binding protein [Xanthobacteraceae bacterium]|jgi:tripartite-type tricarboxylate transporter receptor subunit TctC